MLQNSTSWPASWTGITGRCTSRLGARLQAARRAATTSLFTCPAFASCPGEWIGASLTVMCVGLSIYSSWHAPHQGPQLGLVICWQTCIHLFRMPGLWCWHDTISCDGAGRKCSYRYTGWPALVAVSEIFSESQACRGPPIPMPIVTHVSGGLVIYATSGISSTNNRPDGVLVTHAVRSSLRGAWQWRDRLPSW